MSKESNLAQLRRSLAQVQELMLEYQDYCAVEMAADRKPKEYEGWIRDQKKQLLKN